MFQVQRTMSGLWVLCHLLYLAAEDIREQRISMTVILELGLTGMLHAAATGDMPSILPGCLVLLIGYLSREGIGYGDGWLMLALGMWTDTGELLRLFFGGVILGFLYAFCLRKREIPLVPFLTAAYIIGSCFWQYV